MIYIPGHTEDSIGFYLPEEKIVITGDLSTRKDANTVNLFLPEGDFMDAVSSIKKIIELSPEVLIPGHRNIIYNPVENLERIYRKSLVLKEQAEKYFDTEFPISTYIKWQKLLPKPISAISRLSAMVILYKMFQYLG